MADRARRPRAQMVSGQVALVDPARSKPVQVQEARSGFADVAGQGRQQSAAAHRVATLRLALEALAQPEQRRPLGVCARCLLDQPRRDPGPLLGPAGRARCDRGLEFLEADRVVVDEVQVDQPVAVGDMEEPERKRGIAAREGLEVDLGRLGGGGPDGVDDHDSRAALRQPVLMCVGSRRRWVGTPDHDARGVARRTRVEPDRGGAVEVVERDVAGVVADRVRLDLGRSQSVEEAEAEVVPDDRERARVVRVEDRLGPGGRRDPPQGFADFRDRVLPRDRLELAPALRSDATKR